MRITSQFFSVNKHSGCSLASDNSEELPILIRPPTIKNRKGKNRRSNSQSSKDGEFGQKWIASKEIDEDLNKF